MYVKSDIIINNKKPNDKKSRFKERDFLYDTSNINSNPIKKKINVNSSKINKKREMDKGENYF